MNRIPKKRKEAIIARMAGPQRISITQLAASENISDAILRAYSPTAANGFGDSRTRFSTFLIASFSIPIQKKYYLAIFSQI
jgi:hypothetical protein